ncbi:MAG: HAD family hydrolase [Sulfitobacter sp.]
MCPKLTCIGFDADDTLWHNERVFQLTQSRFAELLADYTDSDTLMARLLESERRNLGHYGFGVKGFVLSMIETAVEVTNGQVPASVISQLLDAGRDMLRHPVDLLPHAGDAVEAARGDHTVILVTKGDLLDQERKLAQSDLGELFHGVEIVSDKTTAQYTDIFSRHGDGAAFGMMVGNSIRSDVVPMINAGGWGVLVPHALNWAVEHADAPLDHPRFAELADLGALANLIDTFNQ